MHQFSNKIVDSTKKWLSSSTGEFFTPTDPLLSTSLFISALHSAYKMYLFSSRPMYGNEKVDLSFVSGWIKFFLRIFIRPRSVNF